MRFSAAVNVPWERGEGRGGLGTGGREEVEAADGRGEAVDAEELEEGLRLWGCDGVRLRMLAEVGGVEEWEWDE
jgi:hypothetical protein